MKSNLMSYDFFVRELGIGIVAYSPLGRGFFSTGAKLLDNLPQDDYRKVCGKNAFTEIHVNYLFVLLMIILIFFRNCVYLFSVVIFITQ